MALTLTSSKSGKNLDNGCSATIVCVTASLALDARAVSTSSAITRPFGPLPLTVSNRTPRSLANRLASGDANTLSPLARALILDVALVVVLAAGIVTAVSTALFAGSSVAVSVAL